MLHKLNEAGQAQRIRSGQNIVQLCAACGRSVDYARKDLGAKRRPGERSEVPGRQHYIKSKCQLSCVACGKHGCTHTKMDWKHFTEEVLRPQHFAIATSRLCCKRFPIAAMAPKRVLGWARRVLHANLTYQPVLDALEHEKDAFEKQFDDLKELPLALRRATDQDLRDEDVDLRARPFLYVVDKSRTEARLIDRCLDIGDDVAAELWDSTGSRIVSQKTICIRETFFGTYVYFMNKNGNVCDIVPGHNEALGNSVAEFTCTIHPKRFLQREILRCWRRLSHNFETLVAPGSRLSSPNRPPLRFRGPPGPTDQEQYPAVEFVNLTEFQERTIAWLCSVFNLNEEQTKAVRMCYGTSLCSVHGPPGTGKTTTAAVLLIVFLVVDTLTKGCVDEVIVASATNTAVDNFLRAFHKRVTQLEEHRLLAIDQDFCGVDGFNSTLFRTAIKNVVKAAKGVFPSKKAPEAMIYRRYGRYAIRDENLTDMYSRSKVQRKVSHEHN
ncbi:hypothetical protein QR680_014821 [Steinernema hermaphroditum]|uniref:DNA2/NAM7 helicase helicase domain-containing protein n=1 Tax=Steinernema hermaphroditum TaxID=289476 RepID=A0AA39M3V8_9BILA|nr:hypothetical protein QR680_014821 [Steinernema hermaphroditum]